MPLLMDKISASPYLEKLFNASSLVPEPELLLKELSSKKQLTKESLDLEKRLDNAVKALTPAVFKDLEAAQETLIQAKQDFSLLWCLAELEDIGTQYQRGVWQTQFAQASIQYALSLAWQHIAQKHKNLASIIAASQYQAMVPGLFIFGMGKLGGYDLNFSSDVDLIAYFDPEVLPVADMVGKSYVCHQVLQELTKLLQQGGASHFVWRVDWRLRPNASANSLAMSTVAAEDYYHYHASPWHRLALMKARVVAGDLDLGKQFLTGLSSFVWRQNLDFRALDDLAEIKQRINLEHPGLRAQRNWVEPIGDKVEGFNVKLGSGGIREIEFIVNAKQLLWGGRHRSLRTSNTVDALAALVSKERIDRQVAEQLQSAYYFLRKVENAIQIHGNQQTHLLPSSKETKQQVLILLDIREWSLLVSQLNQHRRLVNQMFTKLFAEQEQNQSISVVWPEGLSEVSDSVVEAWENGFHIYGVSATMRHRLKPLTHALAELLNESSDHSQQNGPNVNEVVMRLHDFFKSLPQGEQYFRLLAESPSLLGSIVPPLLYSPAMMTLLKQSPHIIDCYVHAEWRYPNPFDSQYVIETEDYGERLERLRRFVNEHLYQLYQQFLRGELAPKVFQTALSELAEHTLELALSVVAEGLQIESIPITVIGMGKVALRRMSPMSDLDLIFIYDSSHISLEQASRFVSRLQTAIATPVARRYCVRTRYSAAAFGQVWCANRKCGKFCHPPSGARPYMGTYRTYVF